MSGVVVVSSYPPRHCGIGAYARTQVARLRAEGHQVTVISPPDGHGDVRVPFASGRPFRWALRLGLAAERIVVHFQPALYYRPRAPVSKVRTSLALLRLVRRRPQTEILVHEADPPVRWRPDYALLRKAFRRATLLFHTEAEWRALEQAYDVRVRGRVVPHVEGVATHGSWTRDDARRRVGVDPQERLFLCAGFLHPEKGFDRAIRAFGEARPGDGRLVIVGSVRDQTARNLAHVRDLRELVAGTPGAELIDRYVDDDEFDAWIAAADLLILPYRRSWSSGTLARAQVIGTRVAVSVVGGLPEQAGAEAVLLRSGGDLVRLFADSASPAVSRQAGRTAGDHEAGQ